MWRKIKAPVSRNGGRDEGSDEDDVKDMSPSSSLVASPLPPSAAPPRKLRSALSLYALMTDAEKASNPKPKDNRTMRFSSTVHICLIPSRDELRTHMNELFWKPEDYVVFKHDAVHELRLYLTANGITAKEAIFQLYQPHDHERRLWLKEFEDTLSPKSKSRRSEEKERDETDRESSDSTFAEEDRYNSEEDDEPRYGRPDPMELKFITGVKTDIELNQESESKDGGESKSGHKVPSRTPSAGSNGGHVWAVSWKPKQSS
jgi:hypothetical protein